MANADLDVYQNYCDTRCGLCQRLVGVGIQCSLCHKWYHLASDITSAAAANKSSSKHGGSSSGGSFSHFASGPMSMQQSQQQFPFASATASPGPQSLRSPGGGGLLSGGESASFLPSVVSNAFSAFVGAAPATNAPCPGIEFPRYLPYFCSDCEACCSAVDMDKITEIYGNLLQEERDEVQSGAPIIFGQISASFVRKRVRAIGKGPEVLSEQFSAAALYGLNNNSGKHSTSGNAANLAAAAAIAALRSEASSAALKENGKLPPQFDFFDDGRHQRTQLKWESMFPRQTLSVLRQVLAHIYPHAYDDTAMIAAAKAAKARRAGKSASAVAAAGGATGGGLSPSSAATIAAASSPPLNNLPPGTSALAALRQQRMMQAQQKFFAPISFVAPGLTMPEEEARRLEENLELLQRGRHHTREQDIEMMDMQHEVTLHRLRWTPGAVGGIGAGEQQHQMTFGPHPIFVNPIASQLRLSEVVIEAGPGSRQEQ